MNERSEQGDVLTAILAATAWSLAALPLLDPVPGKALFRVSGVLVGAVTIFPALLLMFLEPGRGLAGSRFLFGLGAALLASLGLAHAGAAEPWQVAFGYLLPAAGLVAILLQAVPGLDSRLSPIHRAPERTLE
jgi:hypothetical protein